MARERPGADKATAASVVLARAGGCTAQGGIAGRIVGLRGGGNERRPHCGQDGRGGGSEKGSHSGQGEKVTQGRGFKVAWPRYVGLGASSAYQ